MAKRVVNEASALVDPALDGVARFTRASTSLILSFAHAADSWGSLLCFPVQWFGIALISFNARSRAELQFLQV